MYAPYDGLISFLSLQKTISIIIIIIIIIIITMMMKMMMMMMMMMIMYLYYRGFVKIRSPAHYSKKK